MPLCRLYLRLSKGAYVVVRRRAFWAFDIFIVGPVDASLMERVLAQEVHGR